MNFVKRLIKNKCVRLELDFECVMVFEHMKKIANISNLLKDYIYEEERFSELKLSFIYKIVNFREKTLKEKLGSTEIIPFIIIRCSKLLYKIRSKLEEILSYYKTDKIIKKLFLEKIKRLRVKNLVIDKFYKYGLYKEIAI